MKITLPKIKTKIPTLSFLPALPKIPKLPKIPRLEL